MPETWNVTASLFWTSIEPCFTTVDAPSGPATTHWTLSRIVPPGRVRATPIVPLDRALVVLAPTLGLVPAPDEHPIGFARTATPTRATKHPTAIHRSADPPNPVRMISPPSPTKSLDHTSGGERELLANTADGSDASLHGLSI
jgi:hypothetical protein